MRSSASLCRGKEDERKVVAEPVAELTTDPTS